MPPVKRYKTKYPGGYYIMGTAHDGRQEKVFYVRYRRNEKQHDEPVGKQYRDDMTASRANNIRSERIKGHQKSNKERRD